MLMSCLARYLILYARSWCHCKVSALRTYVCVLILSVDVSVQANLGPMLCVLL